MSNLETVSSQKKIGEIDAFICNASRLHLSLKNISTLEIIAKSNPDWEQLFFVASQHGVASLIYYSSTKHGLSNFLPANIYEKFKVSYYENVVRNNQLLIELDKISTLIKEPIILLKGIDLIQNLYPTIAIRSTGDIDILVRKENAKDIWKKIKESGFENALIKASDYKSVLHQKLLEHNQLIISENSCQHLPPLIKNNLTAVVELHWDLFHLKGLHHITISGWDTSKKIKDNIYILSNEIRLIHYCEHFFYHLKECATIRSLCDINEIIESQGDVVDWDYIKVKCTGNELINAMQVTLTLCNKLLETPIPEYFLKESIFSKESISLEMLSKGFKLPGIFLNSTINQQNEYSNHLAKIKFLKKPSIIVVYVYKTFVPDSKWIRSKYKSDTTSKLWKLYLKYWSYLFLKYILLKKATLG